MRFGWVAGVGSILLVGVLAVGCGRSSGRDDEGGGANGTPSSPVFDEGAQNPPGGQDQNTLPGDGTIPGDGTGGTGEGDTGGGGGDTGGGEGDTGGGEGDTGGGGGDTGGGEGSLPGHGEVGDDCGWKPYPGDHHPNVWCGKFTSVKDISFVLVHLACSESEGCAERTECSNRIEGLLAVDLENRTLLGPARPGEPSHCEPNLTGYKFDNLATHKVLVCVKTAEPVDPHQLTVQIKAGLECRSGSIEPWEWDLETHWDWDR